MEKYVIHWNILIMTLESNRVFRTAIEDTGLLIEISSWVVKTNTDFPPQLLPVRNVCRFKIYVEVLWLKG